MVMHGMAGYFETILYDKDSDSNDRNDKANSHIGHGHGSCHRSSLGSRSSPSHDDDDDDCVMLSIRPSSHTSNMYSWFPLFIPLSQPVRIAVGQKITFHIWR